VFSAFEAVDACITSGRVLAVVVDDLVAIDAQPGPVIGEQCPGIFAGFLNPKGSGVIDGEPLEAVGYAGEALGEVVVRNVEFAGIDRSDRFQPFELGVSILGRRVSGRRMNGLRPEKELQR
jgi:hypothetical protein